MSRPTSPLKIPHERGHWDANLEYYLCTLGYAVGYGSLWRFPYLVYENGGGAFLIPYFFFVLILAFPLLFLESSFGQSFQTSVSGVFEKVGKKYKGVGVSEIMTTILLGAYYNFLLAYSILFIWKSFSWPLPWKVEDPGETGELWNSEYFNQEILHLTPKFSDIGNMNYPVLLCNIIAFAICYLCIAKGIKVTGKVVYVTAPAPYLFLFIFLIRGFFLEGAWDGLVFLFKIDWSKLFVSSTWFRAANQVLFQYSIAGGTMYMFASYKKPSDKLIKPAIIIPTITALTGILCGLTVFTYMGHMAHVANKSISTLPLSGPDLVFVAYPAALTLMPGSTIWAILFFAMLFFLGIDSEFAFMETIAGYFEDEKIKIFGKVRSVAIMRIIIVVALFFIGFILNFDGGFRYLALYDDYATIIPLMLSALLECIVLGWIYGIDKINALIIPRTGEEFPIYAKICIKYVIPPIIFVMIISSFYNLIFVQLFEYPWWGSILGVVLMGLPISSIVYYYVKYKDELPAIETDPKWIELNHPFI